MPRVLSFNYDPLAWKTWDEIDKIAQLHFRPRGRTPPTLLRNSLCSWALRTAMPLSQTETLFPERISLWWLCLRPLNAVELAIVRPFATDAEAWAPLCC